MHRAMLQHENFAIHEDNFCLDLLKTLCTDRDRNIVEEIRTNFVTHNCHLYLFLLKVRTKYPIPRTDPQIRPARKNASPPNAIAWKRDSKRLPLLSGEIKP